MIHIDNTPEFKKRYVVQHRPKEQQRIFFRKHLLFSEASDDYYICLTRKRSSNYLRNEPILRDTSGPFY